METPFQKKDSFGQNIPSAVPEWEKGDRNLQFPSHSHWNVLLLSSEILEQHLESH